MSEPQSSRDPERGRVVRRLQRAASEGAWQVDDSTFRRIVESALDYGIISTDAAGVITSWNSGAEAIFRRSTDEALGQPIELIYTEEDRRQGRAELERAEAAANGRASDTRWHARKDGTRFWASGLAMPLLDQHDRLTGFIKVVRDMTGQRRLEDSLEESQERLRQIIDAIPGLVAYIDRGLRYVVANRMYEEWLGLRQHQIIGRTTLEVLGPELHEVAGRYFEAALRGHRVSYEAEALVRGGRRWLRAEYVPHKADGLIVGFVACVMDVGAQKGLETRLQQANAELEGRAESAERGVRELRELLDAARDAILVRDLDSRILYWNDGARELYGYTAAEALGRLSHDLLKTRFPVPLSQQELEMRRTGRWEGILTHRRKDGSLVAVDSRWQLRLDAEGEPQAVLEINRETRTSASA